MMLPSKGLQPSLRSLTLQSRCLGRSAGSRNLSTYRRFDARASIRWQPHKLPVGTQNFARMPIAMTAASSLRFASTAHSATTSSPADASPSMSGSPDFPVDQSPVVTSSSIDTLEFSNVSLSNTTEHIGYLSELGLNFGWGPTSLMQFFYEHVHVMSGLPWWSSILVASFLYRLGFLAYPNMITSDQMARMKAIGPVFQPITQKQREAIAKGDQMAMMQAQREMRLLKDSAGISFKKQFGFVGLQAVLGYGTFHLMREMAQLPVPGLDEQGIAWIKDLTVPDPYFVLPLALATTMHFVLKFGGPGGGGSEFAPPTMDTSATTGHIRQILLWGMPAFIGLIMLWMPACLQLSFASTSLLGMVQGRLMLKPWFRELFGLYPLENAPPLFGPSQQGGRVIDVQKSSASSTSSSSSSSSAPRDLSRRVMDGYQAPTASSIAKDLPTGATQSGGVLSRMAKPFTPVTKFASGLKKEMGTQLAKISGQKDARTSDYSRRAAEYEARRIRELREDQEVREANRRRKSGQR